ncbi:MAG: hypothetical protein VB127_13650 [Sphaerochaeta sp.]|nr:hypothetical protein [Sphaerochaeta sp.]
MGAYQDQHAKVYQKLGKAKQMVLATSFEGRTTARTMSCVVLDGCFYFQTDKTFLKYGQMKGNPQWLSALTTCRLRGCPSIWATPLLSAMQPSLLHTSKPILVPMLHTQGSKPRCFFVWNLSVLPVMSMRIMNQL